MSAIVDGCFATGVCSSRSYFPNAKPAIATTAILSFRSVWNAFLWPMIVINDYDKLTLTVGLKYLKEWDPNWAVLLAGATMSIVPIVIVFLLLPEVLHGICHELWFRRKIIKDSRPVTVVQYSYKTED